MIAFHSDFCVGMMTVMFVEYVMIICWVTWSEKMKNIV